MSLHQAQGNWKLGFSLAFFTMLMWSTLALSLKITAEQMNPITICWYRFIAAFAVLCIIQSIRGKIDKGLFRELKSGSSRLLFAIATVGLSGNYLFYVKGAHVIPASSIQILLQLGVVLFAIGGILIFREKFSRYQWAGLGSIFIGLCLFFENRIEAIINLEGQARHGVYFGLISSFLWAIYALAQKQLLTRFSSQNIMLIIFGGGSLLLWPFVEVGSILNLDILHLSLLVFAAVNTLFAYSALSEALNHWDASRISAVLALTPVGTLVFVATVSSFWPKISKPDDLSFLAVFGAALVVLGSIATSYSKKSSQS